MQSSQRRQYEAFWIWEKFTHTAYFVITWWSLTGYATKVLYTRHSVDFEFIVMDLLLQGRKLLYLSSLYYSKWSYCIPRLLLRNVLNIWQTLTETLHFPGWEPITGPITGHLHINCSLMELSESYSAKFTLRGDQGTFFTKIFFFNFFLRIGP